MSGLLDLIAGKVDDNAIGQLSNQLGTDRGSLAGAIGAALPMLLGALERNPRSASGAEALQNALNRDDHSGDLLNDLGGFLGQRPSDSDNRMVDHILGTRRQAAERALQQTSGLSPQAAGGLLENLAPILMGALGQQSRSSGQDTGGLHSMLDREAQDLGKQQPGGMGLLDKLLDADGDGDADLSDLAQHGAKILGGLMR